jgi:hypothetical protein
MRILRATFVQAESIPVALTFKLFNKAHANRRPTDPGQRISRSPAVDAHPTSHIRSGGRLLHVVSCHYYGGVHSCYMSLLGFFTKLSRKDISNGLTHRVCVHPNVSD